MSIKAHSQLTTKSMNTDIPSKPPTNQQQDAAEEIGHQVANAASEAYDSLSSKVEAGVELTKEYAQHAVDATKDIYQSASAKAEDVLVSSKEYVHRNPFPVALGTLFAGLALGYLVGLAHREQPTFRQRFFC
jgi:ElaB/YqjD/DUF883 family membrane-anchored ribosome-binding protein